jgi:hypothetical protein
MRAGQFQRSVSRALLLTMATLLGRALWAETTTGGLKLGKPADLAIFALPDGAEDDPFDLLLKFDLPVVDTAFEGDFVAGPWNGSGPETGAGSPVMRNPAGHRAPSLARVPRHRDGCRFLAI